MTRFAELNEANRDANMTTVHLNAAYFPAVELLSALVTVGILVVGGIRRSTATPRRRRVRVHRRAEQLLRPDPAALAALHDLPVRDGGVRQDLRAARRGARADRTRQARSSSAASRELRFEGVSFRYGSATRARGRCATSTSTPRPVRPRARGAPARASRRSPSSWPAFTTPPRGACWSTVTTCA